MLGRGIVTDPGLAQAIRRAWSGECADESADDGQPANAVDPLVPWVDLLPLIGAFWELVVARLERRQQAGRLKQWLNFMRNRYPQAQVAYDALRTVHDPEKVTHWMVAQGALAPHGMQDAAK